MRLPTYADLHRFVEVEGWEDKDKASGKGKGDHHWYVFTTPEGERLMTRISHGRGQIRSRDLFAHILRDQLKVTEQQFWSAVDRGERPRRPIPEPGRGSGPAVEAKLARNLVIKVGMSQRDLAGMTKERAVELWNEWLSRGGQP